MEPLIRLNPIGVHETTKMSNGMQERAMTLSGERFSLRMMLFTTVVMAMTYFTLGGTQIDKEV